jgi:hypothetical protein
MEGDDDFVKKAAVGAGAVLAGAVTAYAGYYIYGRWIFNPQVNGELVLQANAPELLAVWRYHQWWGACDKAAFRRVLEVRESVSLFFPRSVSHASRERSLCEHS